MKKLLIENIEFCILEDVDDFDKSCFNKLQRLKFDWNRFKRKER